MRIDLRHSRFATVAAAAGLMLIAAAVIAAPLGAEEEEKRIVKKIRIECDGDDCGEHDGDGHTFVWSSGDHPRRMMFRTHPGGVFLGVLLAELTPELRAHFGVAENAGVMISKVVEESPAAKADLRVGDIVTAVDGQRVASGRELARAIRAKEDGASVLLEVWRDGAVRNLTATVEEREGEPHGMEYAFVVKCEDDEKDCSFARKRIEAGSDWDVEFDCEGDDPCDVRVRCEGEGECECTVNGEPTDCSEIPGFD